MTGPFWTACGRYASPGDGQVTLVFFSEVSCCLVRSPTCSSINSRGGVTQRWSKFRSNWIGICHTSRGWWSPTIRFTSIFQSQLGSVHTLGSRTRTVVFPTDVNADVGVLRRFLLLPSEIRLRSQAVGAEGFFWGLDG